ncbi:prophage endopeptidase tail family protein [Mesobacillus zeae]|uniref:prophage endopeptidase tail family protein n=1 Tax=Mesobacillus zeae TaxID=1917180 RepID=UPI003008BEB7
MPDLVVTNLAGQSELLTDYKNLSRKRKVNGDRSLTFFVVQTLSNAHAFPLVCEESTLEYMGDRYRIKGIDERAIAGTPVKDVSASHVFFDIIDVHQYEVLSPGTKNISEIMSFALKGTGWTFSIIDAFGTIKLEDDDEFGNDNALALFQRALELFQAEFELSGTDVRIRTKIGSTPDFQFRFGHNVKTLSRNVNTNDLSTFIKGYGKELTEKDIKDTSINYASRTGTWADVADPHHYTSQVGATFTASFTGTGVFFRHYADNRGGVWEFVLNGDKKKRVSTWSSAAQTKVVELFRNLDEGTYSMVATFKGDDSKHVPSTGKGTSRGWAYRDLAGSNKTLDIYRERVGDERFSCLAEYTSPMASVYGIRHAPPVKSDSITDQAKLLAALKRAIIDKPEISIELEFIELQNAGFTITKPGLGDTVPTIYEPLGVDVDLRVMEIEDYPESYQSPKVALSNVRRKFADVQFDRAKAILDKIWDENSGKIRYNVYTEAVKKATAALNNSLTQLEYPEGMGIIARDPNDASRFVAVRSSGIGVTTDGGETFGEAITADGVTTSLLTAGQIKTNNIQIIGNDDLFYWDGNYLIAINATDPNRWIRLKSGELYIKRGGIYIERPDGYVVVNDGILQNDFNINGATPPFTDTPITVNGYWWQTIETHPYNCQFYTFKHDSRYLKVRVGLYAESASGGSRISVTDTNGTILAQRSTSITDSNDDLPVFGETLTVDLGVPTGDMISVYVRLNTGAYGSKAFGRVIRMWKEG